MDDVEKSTPSEATSDSSEIELDPRVQEILSKEEEMTDEDWGVVLCWIGRLTVPVPPRAFDPIGETRYIRNPGIYGVDPNAEI